MSPSTPSAQPPPVTYQILADVPTSYFDNDTNTATRGRRLTIKSRTSNRVVIVNVPDAAYTVEGVNAAAQAAIRNADAIAQLGQA